MSSRTYVVILFFWALLTIVTPMLVRLSASANLYATFDGTGKSKEGVNKLFLPRKGLITAIVSPSPSPSPSLSPTSGSAVEDVFSDKLRNYVDQS